VLVVGYLPGHGSPDLGVPVWDLGLGRAAPGLLWREQAAASSATMSPNKARTASCFVDPVFPVLGYLPPAVRGGVGMEMLRMVRPRSGGGGNLPAMARGRGAKRWSVSSASSSPSPAGRGGGGKRWSMERRAACSPFKRDLVHVVAPLACSFLPAGRGGEGEDGDRLRPAAVCSWSGGPCTSLREPLEFLLPSAYAERRPVVAAAIQGQMGGRAELGNDGSCASLFVLFKCSSSSRGSSASTEWL
jgi:hypothetical protein